MSRKAVFLDRDGVINKIIFREGKPTSPRSMDQFEFDTGVPDSLKRLRAAGFELFVVTNQPDLARGLLTGEALRMMTDRIVAAIPVRAVRICPHDDGDACACRKPRPGMLIELAAEYGVDLAQSYIVGDTWRDTQAGLAAGCKSIILDRPYNRDDPADWRVPDLAAAVALILAQIEIS
jgi:D-glycero-D-manno-heptose 1,7-bisphosphate phosphatase